MISCAELIEQLPLEIKPIIIKAFDLFREEIIETAKMSDFEEMNSIVR
ncbi:MAG: hypothetical protein ACP5QK_12475 [Myxococcota bacterium]